MNIKKHPGLFLILSALMVTVCRCSLAPYTPVTVNLSNGTIAKCTQFLAVCRREYLVHWKNEPKI